MGVPQETKATYKTLVESDLIRYTVQPVGAPTAAVSDAAAGAWVWSAYVQIVAAAAVPNPCWLCGVFITTPVVEAFLADFAIASGVALAEVDLAMVHFGSELFAVVEGKNTPYMLPHPIRIVGSPRLAVRVRKSTAASLAGASMKLLIAAAVGT